MVRAANQVNRRHIPCYCYPHSLLYHQLSTNSQTPPPSNCFFVTTCARARTEAFLLGHRHPTPPPPPPHTFLSFLSQIFREPLTPTNHYHQRTYISNSYSSPQASPPNHANIILIYLFLYRRVFSDHTSSWRAALPASLLTARPSSSLLLLVIFLLPPPPPPMSTFWHSTHKLT